MLELEQQFESRYGALAGQPATLEAVQKTLPEEYGPRGLDRSGSLPLGLPAAASGDPVWVRLTGSGKDGDWTKEEEGLAKRLRAELNPETTKATPARWPRRWRGSGSNR